MRDPFAIIIPTMNNRPYLEPLLASLERTDARALAKVYIINNGMWGSCDWAKNERTEVIEGCGNLGWEGGLKVGVACSKEEYVCFLNDDTYFPPCCFALFTRVLAHMDDPLVAAVGPSSNFVSGVQNIFARAPSTLLTVPYLIGFCLFVHRPALEAAGGVEDTLPAGDDLDLSIRLRATGYLLLCDRTLFVWHHGSVTGIREHGGRDQPDGWDSPAYSKRGHDALVAKHGSEKVLELWGQQPMPYHHPSIWGRR